MKGQFLGLVMRSRPSKTRYAEQGGRCRRSRCHWALHRREALEEPDWQVVGLSRRKASDGPRYRHITVDLLDAEDTKRKLAEFTDVTHVFYAAFQAAPGSASDFASN